MNAPRRRISALSRRARSLLFLATALLVDLLAPRGASAQRVVHRVRFGETFATIAKHYYDDATMSQYIEIVNGRSDGSIAPGERMLIPTAWVYIVEKPTTLSALAHQLLGDRRRVVGLTAYNRLRPNKRLRAGTPVVVPFSVKHRVAAGETFAAISSRYFGSPAEARLVAHYNHLSGTQPPANTHLDIPIGRVRITSARLNELTNNRLLGVSPEREQEDRAELQEANGLLRRGDYWHVPLRLVRLLAREQSSDTYIAEVYKLLAIAYVALNQPQLAVDAFEEALVRNPSMALDPVTFSPKVIRAFAEAKAKKRQASP